MSCSTRDLAALIGGDDPLRAARELSERGERIVTWTRSPAPDSWLVDGALEGSVEAHRGAHREGRPSEARVGYGAAREPEQVAERLLALGELAQETGLLRALLLSPEGADESRPASWGYEDLGVIAAARLAAPAVPWIRPDWRLLGRQLCQVAVAFGATDWLVPADETADPDLLATAVGVRAVER